MAGPTVTVKLDDGTGAFPYDISSYVLQGPGITISSHGRQDEQTEVQPTTLSLTLNNTDGRFSLGSTIINATSPIYIDNQIRVSYTVSGVTTHRFTGYVQTWPVDWPGGGPGVAMARITAVDALARMSRRPLRSVIEEEALLRSPVLYCTLGDDAGSVTAGDTSGSGYAALTLAGTGAAPVFGNATGPGTDGLTAAQFSGAKFFQFPRPLAIVSGTERTIVVAFSTSTTTNPDKMFMFGLEQSNGGGRIHGLGIDTSGNVTGPLVSSGTDYRDGNTHVAVLVNSATASTLYVDSVVKATSGNIGNLTFDMASIGGSSYGIEVTGVTVTSIPFTGVLAHAEAFATALDATAVAAVTNSMLTGFAGERSDQRIARYLSYAGVASANVVAETGIQTVPHYEITGQSVSGAISKVNEAENGVVFVRGDGKWVIHNRQHRTLKTSADWSLVATNLNPDTSVIADMQRIVNIATSSRQGGATQATQGAASITKHGQYPASYDSLLVSTDQQALDRINWQVGTHAEPGPRFNTLRVDLFGATTALQQAAQAREVGDRIVISGLPSQTPAGLADQVIDGWTETLNATEWSMTFNTSPWSLEQAWVLDSSTQSVLGSTTRLSY